MKPFSTGLKRLAKDNRGSTIVVVIISMSFVTILAAILMFASYTNYQMKVLERESKQNQYEAETVLNEVRAGVQQIVSEAIVDAYTGVLTDYNTALEQTENVFTGNFKKALYDWTTGTEDDIIYFIIPGAVEICNAELLKSFISEDEQKYVSLKCGHVEERTEAIVIHDLDVIYTKDGLTSSISTDVFINMPEFTYTLSELILNSVPDFTVIAREKLLHNAGVDLVVVDGSAYAGQIDVFGNGNVIEVGVADNFICQGALNVNNGARFFCGVNSSLWAGDIRVNAGVSERLKWALQLEGNTYVSDDLELTGSDASAFLGGRYYGFGNSITDSSKSSAIILNGKKALLDMSGLEHLMLAGTAFVNMNIAQGSASDVLMGESISVKSNQLAYLIPANCLTQGISNPYVISGTAPSGDDLLKYVNRDTVLWGNKRLSDYIDGIQLIYYPLGNSQTLVYYFMQFKDDDENNITAVSRASNYFMDYFTNNSAKIEEYLTLYSRGISSFHETSQQNIAGNAVTFSIKDNTVSDVKLIKASDKVSNSTSLRLKTMFANLCTTLNANVSADLPEGASVYDYIVNEEEVEKLVAERTEFRDEDGVIRAIVCRGDVAIDTGFSDTIKIIIATGNVTVTKPNFTGLVISGQIIDLRTSLKADRNGVTNAFEAVAEIGGKSMTLVDFLKIGSQKTTLPTSINWDLDRIVTFSDWSKN